MNYELYIFNRDESKIYVIFCKHALSMNMKLVRTGREEIQIIWVQACPHPSIKLNKILRNDTIAS